MKKLFLAILFLLAFSPLFAWTFLQDTEQRDMERLLPKILSGREIRVCIDVVERHLDKQEGRYRVQLYDGKDKATLYSMSADIVRNAYQSWFRHAETSVRSAGRKKEFKDLLDSFPHSLKFRFINIGPGAGSNAYKACESFPVDAIDLRVRATLFSQGNGGHAVQTNRASFTFELRPDNTGLFPAAGIRALSERSSMTIALHEVGHTLGLGDLYTGPSEKNSRIYSLASFYSPTSIVSIMNQSETLTCADADALINLVDFYASSDSPRAAGGWLSLCPQYGNILYAKGLPLQVSYGEVQAQQAFIKKGRKGVPPLQGKIAQARQQAQLFTQNRKKEDFQKERARQEIVDSVQQAMNPSAASSKPAYKRKICALCEQEIEPWDMTRLKYPDGTRLYLHDACNAKRKAGADISPVNKQKYGEKIQ